MTTTQRFKKNIDNMDRLYLVVYILICVYYTFAGLLTFLTAGGIILVLGAWFVYKGEIFFATFIYLLADVMWIFNAYQINDYHGMFFILLGMLLALATTLKMHYGTMLKSLHTGEKV